MRQHHEGNGLSLIVSHLPHRNTVSVNVRVDAGTRHEQKHQEGIAHFVEHLLFQGTQRYPSNYELTSRIERLGAEIWGATHSEYTSFWLNTPRKYLAQTLPLFLEMFRYPVLTSEQIEHEKQIILDELAESQEQGWHQVQFLLDKALWGDHPLAHTPQGTTETIQAFQPDDIRAFFAQHYLPGRMVAAVVGDVRDDEVIALFQEGWGDWIVTAPPGDHSPPGERSSQPFQRQVDDQAIVHLLFGLLTPPLDHPDMGAYRVLNTLLGGGMSSRLYTTLRSKQALCYSIENNLDELRHACVLSSYIVTQPEQVVQTIEQACMILHDVGEGNISPAEFEQSRGQALGQLLMEADLVPFHAKTLNLSAFLRGRPMLVEQQLAQIEQTTHADVQRAARALLQPGNLHAACVGPVNDQTWQRCIDVMTAWR